MTTELAPTQDATPTTLDPYAFPRLQTLVLLAQAENPLASIEAIVSRARQLTGRPTLSARTIVRWRRQPAYRAAYELVRHNPVEAGQFLLAWSQADAVATLRRNLKEGARVSTDAARAILSEHREQGAVGRTKGLAELIERALANKDQG